MVQSKISKRKSDLCKEVQVIYDLATSLKEENIFQRDPLYLEFKAKNDGRRGEIMKLYIFLLQDFKFYQESIYWCHKFLEDRVCNKEEKADTFKG